MAKATNDIPPLTYAQECWLYEPDTAHLLRWRERPPHHFRDSARYAADVLWRKWNTAFANRVAGAARPTDGRWQIRLDGVIYFRYRLVWKMVLGEDPPRIIDHINGDPSDDRISNLRAATHTQNLYNQKTRIDSTSGLKGAQKHHTGKSHALITINGIVHYLGSYDTPEEAHAAYMRAAEQHFGEFANPGVREGV